MAPSLYLLDTNICSFAMRHDPTVRARLIACVARGDTVAISAIVYSELRDGVLGPKASARHAHLLDEFIVRVDAVLPWDKAAVDQTAAIRRALRLKGTPIGPNDAAIAGHALALDAVLATNNVRAFSRVEGLRVEDWSTPPAHAAV
ncbi:MAG: type II toxin-antitoxin system VapC family toxin [Propionibacteriaceae bacterium]|jgi:tRNA(fMet)-specific endonuclease VapC|nr:type II toxin-antitoxin system VapC family toxin [Propionibacteriaceae bacterium]